MNLTAEVVREVLRMIEMGDMCQVADDVLRELRKRHQSIADNALWIPEYILARRHALDMVRRIDEILDARKSKAWR